MSRSRTPSPTPGRTMDIVLSGQEIITLDLDDLDASPDDLLDLLKDSRAYVEVWTKLAAEYWRKGNLDAAQKLALGAVDSLRQNGRTSDLPTVYCLLANIELARARKAPKLILKDARIDDMKQEKTRESHHREATGYLNKSTQDATHVATVVQLLSRGIVQLNTRNVDDAMRCFDAVLIRHPTNLVALLGKARILFARKQYGQSLRLFQDVLRYNPSCIPDPRIGIGLCLWNMDQKDKARLAWQRSVEVNPSQWPAYLLLGLEAINSSKNENQTDGDRRREFLAGTAYISKAFNNSNQKSAAAANALCELLMRKQQYEKALKLAERTIQFADTLNILTDGYIRAGRVLQERGHLALAIQRYTHAKENQPGNVLASIGLAQAQLKGDEILGAVHTLDKLLEPPNASRSIEATVMLASLRAHPRPGVSSSDQAKEKVRARELFDRVAKALLLPEHTATPLNGNAAILPRAQRRIADDPDVHLEIARLWYEEDLTRAERALHEAQRITESSGKSNPRILNNLAVLRHFSGKFDEAREMYQRALTDALSTDASLSDNVTTTILYNLARAYEGQGESVLAAEAYEKLLSRHPEYVDAKVRQAQVYLESNQYNEGNILLKQALDAHADSLNLRAYYTHYLLHFNFLDAARKFVFATLKDFDKHDVFSTCAVAWLHYQQARENRDGSPKGIEERRRNFRRSAEFYERALQFDPTCAVAAQGLAIVIAEDALGNLGGSIGPPAPDEAQKRIKNAREALDILAKVRESLDDGSVYANMGHCYYACDEYDRAIESYETASKKFYHGQNVPVLLCLCRAWYAKANKDQSFVAMNTALKYAQTALHLHPFDKVISYNIAMIEQKSAELLVTLPASKRTLSDLELGKQRAAHAQAMFQSLARDKSPAVPYSRDIADQRRKYGDSVLRRCDDQLAVQKQYEAETQAKLDEARRRRQEEKAQHEALEKARLEKLAREAGELAEKRRKAREEALQWSKQLESDEDEKEARKAKKPRRKPEDGDDAGDDGGESRKRRRGKIRRENGEDDAGALFSEDEESRPAPRKRTKKRVVKDDEDEDGAGAGAPKKKQIKSKEWISDSDEDMA